MDPRAIVVVPFVDLVGSSDTARFAVSLSESVRNGLAAMPELRIAGPAPPNPEWQSHIVESEPRCNYR